MNSTFSKFRLAMRPALLMAILLMSLTSCEKADWYDIKSSKNIVVPSTVANFQAIMDNSQHNFNYPVLGEIGTDDHYTPDAGISLLTPRDINAYTWSHDQPYVNLPDWSITTNTTTGPYVYVYDANLVLEGLAKIAGGTDQYNDVKGQALFVRGFSFFSLSQVFAPPYNQATATTDLGIPLRLESDVNLPTVRSTVQQTYDQIISDLKQAESLLPLVAGYRTRACKSAAEAILARTYMSMGDYGQAATYANLSLQNNSTLIDYNTLSPTTSPIFPLYGNEVLFHALLTSSSAISNGFIDPALYNSYASNDLRKSLYFKVNTNNTVVFNAGYYYTTSFFGPTTDEMYLTRSECYARAGNTDAALTDLNALLVLRYKKGTFIPITAVSADDALNKILIERRKELVNRGIRWMDLRRLNKEERFKITLTRIVQGKSYTLEPNSFRYTFPIPDDIIQISHIQQNPGW